MVVVLSGCMLASLVAGASAKPIFSDDFADGNRAGWFTSATSGGLQVSSDSATHKLTGKALVASNTTAVGLMYFDATTLAVGDSLAVGLRISSGRVWDHAGNLVFGVFHSSGGPVVGADNFSGATDFSAYRGYRMFTNTGSSAASGTTVGKRNPDQAAIIDGAYTALTDGIGNGVNLTRGSVYSVSILLVRTGVSSLAITFSLNGVTLKAVDNAAPHFTFDTFAYKKSNTRGDTAPLYIDDVSVVCRRSGQ